MAKDPVCGMEVDETKAAATLVHQGTAYYFCAQACKTTFDKDPAKYVGKKEEAHGASCH
jgi:YHS domain-containing protein